MKKLDIKIPKHVAIIMDGNGRWAVRQGISRGEGHLAGVEAVSKIITRSIEVGINTLSLFTLSSENLGRPPAEVQALLEIHMDVIQSDSDTLCKEGIRVKFIGDHSVFSEQLQLDMKELMDKTSNNTKMNLVIAMNYSGQWDVFQAAKKMAKEVKQENMETEDISLDYFKDFLITADYDEPDLLIRTSGEYRISNFYLWQLAYTELYFTDVLWPDFDTKEFDKALDSFSARDRKFGLRNE